MASSALKSATRSKSQSQSPSPSSAQPPAAAETVQPSTKSAPDGSGADRATRVSNVDANAAQPQEAATATTNSQAPVIGSGNAPLASPQVVTASPAQAVTPPTQPGNPPADDSAAEQAPVPPTQTALPGLTTEAAIERIDGILRRVAMEHDKEGFFQAKVNAEMPGCHNYYEKIKRPMYFGLIREKLRRQEYRTLRQLQQDVELICSNATTFNQKVSKVYKNAQALLRASRKQFTAERVFLQEAVYALHPQGVQAARAEEAEEEKKTKMSAPPKKLPSKPSKPSKPMKPPKPGNTLGGMPKVPAAFGLQNLIPVKELLVQMEDDDPCYSSFSDSDFDDSAPPRRDEAGAAAERIPSSVQLPGGQAASTLSASRPNAWKLQRKGLEWQIRWLEHRIRDLNHQHERYAQKLKEVRARAESDQLGKSTQAATEECGTEKSSAGAVQAPDESAAGKGKVKRRRRRQAVPELGGKDSFIDHPFFSAFAGLRRNKQIVRSTEEAEVSDQDDNYPARVYAAAELLERHTYGLKQQLCQPGSEIPFTSRTGFMGAAGKANSRGQGLKGRNSSLPKDGRATKRQRRTESGLGGVILPEIGSSRFIEPLKAVEITTPTYQLLSEEELQERETLLQTYKARQQERKVDEDGDVDMGAYSSSSEDTSDEAYAKIHTVLEEKEKASYKDSDKKKKNKLKPSNSTVEDQLQTSSPPVTITVANPAQTLPPKPSGVIAAAVQPGSQGTTVTVSTSPTATNPSGQAAPVTITVGTPTSGDGKGPSAAAVMRGKGRARGRGRPPHAGRGGAATTTRLAGPGRGHKNVPAKPQAVPNPAANPTPAKAGPQKPVAAQNPTQAVTTVMGPPKPKAASAQPKGAQGKPGTEGSNPDAAGFAAPLPKGTASGVSVPVSQGIIQQQEDAKKTAAGDTEEG